MAEISQDQTGRLKTRVQKNCQGSSSGFSVSRVIISKLAVDGAVRGGNWVQPFTEKLRFATRWLQRHESNSPACFRKIDPQCTAA